jgi:hypothetical protein
LENNWKKQNIIKAVQTGSLLFIVFLFFSCRNDSSTLVAKVGKYELEKSVLNREIANNENASEDDRKKMIQNWVNNALILSLWDSLDYNSQESIRFKVHEYKASLIQYELENQLIKKQLDTLVSEEEMRTYYAKNKKDFELKDFIVKVLYLKVPEKLSENEKLNTWFMLRNPSDLENIKKLANESALNFYYNEDKWIYFEDLLKEIPLEGIDKEKFIFNRTKTHFVSNGASYYLNILDYKLKNTISPFEFEKENIKQRILTYRIKKLREILMKKILQHAKQENEILYYNH